MGILDETTQLRPNDFQILPSASTATAAGHRRDDSAPSHGAGSESGGGSDEVGCGGGTAAVGRIDLKDYFLDSTKIEAGL